MDNRQKRQNIKHVWVRFWMSLAGIYGLTKLSTFFASLLAPPHKARTALATMCRRGYIDPKATIYHSNLYFGNHVYVSDRVLLYQAREGGKIHLGNKVCILRDTILETALGGQIIIDDESWIHPRCQLNAYLGSIKIGKNVQIAPNCAFYSYDHSFLPDKAIIEQPLITKGDIVIEDGVWIGVGTIVLSGVKIGQGAVIGAGSLVTGNIEANSIAAGRPAKMIKNREELRSD
jgi:acetyltransferase-like isoleucine patch superfamily enzyme